MMRAAGRWLTFGASLAVSTAAIAGEPVPARGDWTTPAEASGQDLGARAGCDGIDCSFQGLMGDPIFDRMVSSERFAALKHKAAGP